MSSNRTRKWINSLANLGKALDNLKVSLETPVMEKRDLSGIIKDFELAYELTWKVLRTLLQIKGHESDGARDVFKKCYQLNILNDDKVWLDMIDDRNATVHTYNELQARQMVERIRSHYESAIGQVLKFCTTEQVD